MSPRMQVSLNDDGTGATLRFLEGSGIDGSINLNADQLSQLIASLGRVRQALVEKQTPPPIEGVQFTSVYRTNWALQIDTLTEGSTLAFQHPAYGPVGVVFAPPDVETLLKGLQRHRAIVHSTPDAARKPS
ncbi:hypothetical protein [Kozakia baliensis]|uniref:Uncharacterized protein n=1 Tax=Kozakia baliensis TaxID=153496 RepID=A0A1D8UVI2_9PROT|nr:hypothetical protein [Kozakia baliensis]AOX17602.1 hypothetical protein A0U89_11095 [Kozakia baliensis]GEL62917.1 hypothetical protein KBA01_02030 [Kozakia baliensis]